MGYERIQEIENSELAMDRMKALYEKKGYSKDWIDKRARGIAVRQDLTDEWKQRGVKSSLEYDLVERIRKLRVRFFSFGLLLLYI